MTNSTKTVHNEARSRYELYIDGDLASIADYRLDGKRAVFFHTETSPPFRGRGLGAELVEWALDDVRTRGLTVDPQCWFVADFVDDHPEYRDLVA
ncbi:MAG TPA: GNAT family N-acetyltransferase [Actinomycetota bacterium]|jgi:predicted GNAT family acetyltransferase|nr:GNAT family N-acetyltransferase [Actinomycetota bacterium]